MTNMHTCYSCDFLHKKGFKALNRVSGVPEYLFKAIKMFSEVPEYVFKPLKRVSGSPENAFKPLKGLSGVSERFVKTVMVKNRQNRVPNIIINLKFYL
jgi:hypothetical protein